MRRFRIVFAPEYRACAQAALARRGFFLTEVAAAVIVDGSELRIDLTASVVGPIIAGMSAAANVLLNFSTPCPLASNNVHVDRRGPVVIRRRAHSDDVARRRIQVSLQQATAVDSAFRR